MSKGLLWAVGIRNSLNRLPSVIARAGVVAPPAASPTRSPHTRIRCVMGWLPIRTPPSSRSNILPAHTIVRADGRPHCGPPERPLDRAQRTGGDAGGQAVGHVGALLGPLPVAPGGSARSLRDPRIRRVQ